MSVSAVALTIYSKWRMDQNLAKPVPNVIGHAVKSLSEDLQKQNSKQTDVTLLSIMLLQFQSTFENLLFAKKRSSVHHLGALALVREFGHPSTWSATASEYLDTLGIQVADIQYRAAALQGDTGLCSSFAEVDTLLDDIQRLDERLILWQGQVSTFWGPYNWTPPGIIFPPIQSFQGTCQIYTSVTAARRMNDWRAHRLTLAITSLKLIRGQKHRSPETPESGESDTSQSGAYVLVKRIQWLVDGICASVPFCLGNRSRVGSIADFSDQTWKFPSCHDMAEMYGLYGRSAEPKGLESFADHYSHALTQGSWLMLSNLALLVATFLGNKTLTPLFPLKQGQLKWICQQYLRNLSLNSIEWTHDNSLVSKVLTGVDLPTTEVLVYEASRCIRCVSRGLQLTDDP
ncbi:hypothetical protein E4T46_08879 [Aureobasidium subglaciale]|nr:hypothetical protein E4T40_08886 [Aureobasidium subglaciale]KAI5217400.1 hypothetical protein E4T41_08845 [Aureobasidium subglaciale]KAI5255046.1 hypothetical protein E4T46_08879 [Aureobasidium subglaciale]